MARHNASGDAQAIDVTSQDIVPTGVPFPVLQMLANMAEMEPETFAMADAFNSILDAETEAEMWSADDKGPEGGRNIVDVEMELRKWDVRFSREMLPRNPFIDPESGRQMYLLLQSARLADGHEFTWNTSAPLIVAKIIWLDRHGRIPCRCVIRSTDLGAGQAVLKLKELSERAL